MHMLGEWNSLGEKFWGLHVLMQIYYFLRSSGTGSLKSRIRDCVYIFSIWVLLNCNAWDTLLLSWSERKQSVMLFLLFIYSLLSGVSAERSGTDCHDSNNLGSTGTWLFFWKVCVLQGCVTMCTKERGIVPSFTSPSFACNSNYSKAFELPSCFSENMSCWRLLKPDFKGSSCGRIPHCFLLLTVL